MAKGNKLTDISGLKFGDTFKYYDGDYESAVYYSHSLKEDRVTMENLDDGDSVEVYTENLKGWYYWNE